MPGPLFTAETARIAGRKGGPAAAAVRRLKNDLRARLDLLEPRVAKLERAHRNGHHPKQPAPAPPPMPPPAPTAEAPTDPAQFALFRLERVRAMLLDVDARIRREQDPLASERLGRLAKSLHDQFLDLSGHSRAGQRRPGRESRLPAKSVMLAPLGRADEPDSEPACEQVPEPVEDEASCPGSSTPALPVEPEPVPMPGDVDDPPPED